MISKVIAAAIIVLWALFFLLTYGTPIEPAREGETYGVQIIIAGIVNIGTLLFAGYQIGKDNERPK